MLVHRAVGQPGTARVVSRNVDALTQLISAERAIGFDAAVAYVTDSGVDALLYAVDQAGLGARWSAMKKRFLVSCDWFRSDPTALERLHSTPSTTVRVHDGARVVARGGCVPYVPWHPKWFAVVGPAIRGNFCGSGNLSRNGLLTGHEVGVLQIVSRPTSAAERAVDTSLRAGATWFERHWRPATPLMSVWAEYQRRFAENPPNSAGRNDDDADASGRVGKRHGLTPAQLAALSAAPNFWIDAGILSHNRGPNRPGNQLMMSALMRVFFGAAAIEVDQNTLVAKPVVEHPRNNAVQAEAPIRFSDNSMDVISLPVPETPWPATYDDMTLLFTKVARASSLHFVLTVRDPAGSQGWRNQSIAQGTAYEMRSGRKWGVFR